MFATFVIPSKGDGNSARCFHLRSSRTPSSLAVRPHWATLIARQEYKFIAFRVIKSGLDEIWIGNYISAPDLATLNRFFRHERSAFRDQFGYDKLLIASG